MFRKDGSSDSRMDGTAGDRRVVCLPGYKEISDSVTATTFTALPFAYDCRP
jgi:hypothetical protein